MKRVFVALCILTACANPQPGPDKTAEGTILGGAWGAGAGAVIGNQVSTSGMGAGLGAGFGAAAGLLNGIAYDRMESNLIRQDNQITALEARNRANLVGLAALQESLDNQIAAGSFSGIYQVFFDEDSTTLKSGAIANIQTVAESIKVNPAARVVHVIGHTDDTGNPEHNRRLAEGRAREVHAYLIARGISADQVKVSSFGSERPIASNSTPQGRQLNRRVDIYFGS